MACKLEHGNSICTRSRFICAEDCLFDLIWINFRLVALGYGQDEGLIFYCHRLCNENFAKQKAPRVN